jgi:chloride channel protein, CIC family
VSSRAGRRWGRTGFDVPPARPPFATFVLLLAVTLVASTFAHLFKTALREVLQFYADRSDPTEASVALGRVVLFVVASGSVLAAATIGHLVQRRWSHRVGIEAIAASARGDARSISFRATLLRLVATFTVSAGLVSIGRESAIVESGGVVGSVTGRESGGRGDALASAGIAAAFASAYNAPVAAVLYAEEHLRIRQSLRATLFVVSGALAGHLFTRWLFESDAIFPDVTGSPWRVTWLGLAVTVPTVVIARSFLQLRVLVGTDAVMGWTRCSRPVAIAVLAAVAGLSVAAFPLAAGNGMDALDRGPGGATLTLALALVVGKLVGTTAALGAGAPGGVLSPTMGVAGGTALLVLLAVDGMGFDVVHVWDAMVPAMAIGVAVGMRSPLVAIFLIPELLGDYTLVLPMIVVVGTAWLLDRALDRVVVRVGAMIPSDVYDEDA